MSDDFARRRDEADALLAIFGEDFLKLSDNSEWRFQYWDQDSDKIIATLTCYLPDDYPSCSAPVLVLDGPSRPTPYSGMCEQFLASFVPGEEFGLTLGGQFSDFCREHCHIGDSSELHVQGVPMAKKCLKPQHVSESTAQVAADTDNAVTEAVIKLGSLDIGAVKELYLSLTDFSWSSSDSSVGGGFQQYGAGIFVHGELGIAVEFKDTQGAEVGIIDTIQSLDRRSPREAEFQFKGNVGDLCLHISVDGLDAEEVAVWAGKEIEALAFSQSVSTPPCAEVNFGFGPKLVQWADSQRAAGERKYGSADGIVDDDVGPTDTHIAGLKLTGNAAWKARLQAGETVQFRGGGNSLHPRIKSGECCKYEPVVKHDDVREKDIVFCQIKGRYWGHMVKTKTFVGGQKEYEYTISNIHGWENGTIGLEHIYGKVVDHWK